MQPEAKVWRKGNRRALRGIKTGTHRIKQAARLAAMQQEETA